MSPSRPSPPDKIPDAIDRALKTVRTRIEGFGVSESVVQKAGNDRIIVEIPGYDDPQRAENLVKQQAFLQFLITDKTQALDKVLPRFDQIVKQAGLVATAGDDEHRRCRTGEDRGRRRGLAGAAQRRRTPAKAATAKKDTGKAKADTTAKLDTAGQKAGAFSGDISPGGMPGEYFVPFGKVPEVQRYLAAPGHPSGACRPANRSSGAPTPRRWAVGLVSRAVRHRRQGDHHRAVHHGRAAVPDADRRDGGRVHPQQRGRPPFPDRDGTPCQATTWRSCSTTA